MKLGACLFDCISIIHKSAQQSAQRQTSATEHKLLPTIRNWDLSHRELLPRM